jgi:SAM-dependent methyltransferase
MIPARQTDGGKTMDVEELSELKQGHRAMWDSGDYPSVAESVEEVGERLVERAVPARGEALLDVAAGSGNVAVPAAHAGAHVTALDLAPSLLEAGRERASAAGVEIDWVEGDAEALPFADASFDVVLSALGVQFTPDHHASARELARVCRPGGRVGVACWTPDGLIGRFLATVGRRMPVPPPGVMPPPLWGDPEHVDELFAGTGVELRYETHAVDFVDESAEGFVDYMAQWYGPLLRARTLLEPQGDWSSLRDELLALVNEFDTGGASGELRSPSQYLIALGAKE